MPKTLPQHLTKPKSKISRRPSFVQQPKSAPALASMRQLDEEYLKILEDITEQLLFVPPEIVALLEKRGDSHAEEIGRITEAAEQADWYIEEMKQVFRNVTISAAKMKIELIQVLMALGRKDLVDQNYGAEVGEFFYVSECDGYRAALALVEATSSSL